MCDISLDSHHFDVLLEEKIIDGKFVENPLFVIDDVISCYWAGRFFKIITFILEDDLS